jgi:hypothetical protein
VTNKDQEDRMRRWWEQQKRRKRYDQVARRFERLDREYRQAKFERDVGAKLYSEDRLAELDEDIRALGQLREQQWELLGELEDDE